MSVPPTIFHGYVTVVTELLKFTEIILYDLFLYVTVSTYFLPASPVADTILSLAIDTLI